MTTLNVGAGQQYTTLASAVAAAHDGDVIKVQAGTYTNDFAEITHKITIEGVGGMVNLVATGQIPNGKAILITDTDVTLDHIAFSGATVRDGNGAGIRYQGGNLTITNSYFHDNQNGILGASDPNGTITIDHSEFSHNGSGTGYTHNMYIGNIAKFTLANSYSHDAVAGHEVKSRAQVNVIENNRIQDGPNGNASYEIDLPNGGQGTIANNVIEKGAHAQNPHMIAFGEEGAYANSALLVTGNTLLNDKGASANAVWTAAPATVTNNMVYGFTAAQTLSGQGTVSGTTTLITEPKLDTSSAFASSTTPSTPTSTDQTEAPVGVPTDYGTAGAVIPNGHVLTVGVGKMYSTIAAAVSAAHDGDTVAVDAGTYTNDSAYIASKIILEGVGGMVHLVSNNGHPLWYQAPIIVNADATIKNFDISGAAITDKQGANAAGIRYHAGNLTLVNDHIHNNQDGILGTPDADNGTGTITMIGSEIDHNGNASGKWAGYTHNLYINNVQTLTIKDSYIYDASVGHEVKSRAQNTVIENSRISSEAGTGSYLVDAPNGGNVTLTNDVLAKGPNAQNPALISYGEEGVSRTENTLNVTGTTFVADYTKRAPILLQTAATNPASVTNSSAYGLALKASGKATFVNDTVLTTHPKLDTSSPVHDPATTPPTTTPPTTATPPPTTTPSTGAPLVLYVSEDAWQGDAQFTISVDGTTIGGVRTATASHAAGASQAITVDGGLSAGVHKIGITFLNDAKGTTASANRNLYLDKATLGGETIAGSTSSLPTNGTKTFTIGVDAAGKLATSTLTLNVSEDAYNGDAQMQVWVDGKQVGGGNYTVTASHAAGNTQAITISGIAESYTAHDIWVGFVNDLYRGSPSADRNLYLNSAQFDGKTVAGAATTFLRNGWYEIKPTAPADWLGQQ